LNQIGQNRHLLDQMVQPQMRAEVAAAAARAVAGNGRAARAASGRNGNGNRGNNNDDNQNQNRLFPTARTLPDLSSLTQLRSINLADNSLTAVPFFLLRLGGTLEHVDVSNNAAMRFCSSASSATTATATAPAAPAATTTTAATSSSSSTSFAPASFLSALPKLRAIDVRGCHVEVGLGYWSESKCETMGNLCALAKAGKRRRPHRLKVFMDSE